MHKLKRPLILVICAVAVVLWATGCSHTKQLPVIPGTAIRPVKVSAVSLLGPTINQVVFVSTNTGEIVSLPGYSHAGNGILGNAVDAAGTAVGLHLLGRGISKSGDDTTVNQSGGGATANSQARSSASAESSATAADKIEVKRNRPPDNRPPFKSPKDQNH